MPVMVIVVGRRGKRGRGGERGERGDNLSLTHPLSFQITEMYSSGGDLHLELLSGQLQGSKSLWVRKYCIQLYVATIYVTRSGKRYHLAQKFKIQSRSHM